MQILERRQRPAVEAEAVAAVNAIRRALGHLVAALPGRVNTAAKLQRALGVDYNLCWHVFSIVKRDDPLEAARHVPSMISMRKLAAAATAAGIRAEIADAVLTAMAGFEDVVKQHASDRATFKAMVATRAGEESAGSVSLQQRKGVFRGESQLWGAQVATFYRQLVLKPVEVDGQRRLMLGSIGGKYGFQRLRAEAAPIVFGTRQFGPDGSVVQSYSEPLDPDAAASYGAPVLVDFCTQPIPRLGKLVARDGWVYYTLGSEQLGRSGAVDIVTGQVLRRATLTDLGGGRRIFFGSMRFVTPTELAVMDFMVHRPSFGSLRPRVSVVADGGGDFVTELVRPVPQFPVYEKVVEMGPVPEVIPVSEVSRYSDLTAHVFHRLGWAPDEFDVYRLEMAYPILHTECVMWFDVT